MDNPTDDGPCEVTITAPNRAWLQVFVRQLVEDRLAAAAHVDIMETVYRWDGEVHQATEARAVLHTSLARTQAIIELTHKSHPFEVPCVVVRPIDGGDSSYLNWIMESAL